MCSVAGCTKVPAPFSFGSITLEVVICFATTRVTFNPCCTLTAVIVLLCASVCVRARLGPGFKTAAPLTLCYGCLIEPPCYELAQTDNASVRPGSDSVVFGLPRVKRIATILDSIDSIPK